VKQNGKVLKFERRNPSKARALHVLPQELEHARPKKRGDCVVCPSCQAWRDHETTRTCGHTVDEAIFRSRPCVFVGCHHSLYLEVTFAGSIRFMAPNVEPEEMTSATCVLDIVDREPTLEDIGKIFNGASRERVRQLEVSAIRKLEPLLELFQEESRG
jgi:hypothetical protein